MLQRKLGWRESHPPRSTAFIATVCIESGVDIPTVSRWLGHKDGGALAMRTYGHLRREHQRRPGAESFFRANRCLTGLFSALRLSRKPRQSSLRPEGGAGHFAFGALETPKLFCFRRGSSASSQKILPSVLKTRSELLYFLF